MTDQKSALRKRPWLEGTTEEWDAATNAHRDRIRENGGSDMNETTVPAPTAAPPKITLAALVRKGCEGTFQAIGHRAYDLAGQTYVCASGAAALAAGMIQPTRGPSPEADGSIHYSDVPVRERTDLHFIVDDMLLAPAPPPPASCDHPLVGADADIEGLMIHLNDGHRWPRERIAAYLEEWER